MEKFMEVMAGMSKAILGGSLITAAAGHTTLMAIVAAFGIGVMPEPVVLQEALVSVIAGIAGGFLIYLVPNYKPAPSPDVIEENTEEGK